MLERRIFSVSQVNRYLQGLISADFLLSDLWLRGELSNCKLHSSGHFFFTLKDRDSAIGGLMFQTDVKALPFLPEDGLSVVVWGRVQVYERTGQYRIIAELMEPVGAGALTLAFEQLKNRLSEEGLFDEDFKRPLPAAPRHILVVTSPTGAAVRDIITVAGRRDPSVQLTVIPTLVQGDAAPPAIAAALEMANEYGGDLIILGRGGGSLEDLWAFNTEQVARAIFASDLPVISAVGHETDFTIADFVADLRAPTPSAAAELAVPSKAAKADVLQAALLRMDRAVTARLEKEKLRLRQDASLLAGSLPRRLDREDRRLGYLIRRLEGVSPLGVLSRGYALVYGADGGLLREAVQASLGDELTVLLRDGSLKARVTELGETNQRL